MWRGSLVDGLPRARATVIITAQALLPGEEDFSTKQGGRLSLISNLEERTGLEQTRLDQKRVLSKRVQAEVERSSRASFAQGGAPKRRKKYQKGRAAPIF